MIRRDVPSEGRSDRPSAPWLPRVRSARPVLACVACGRPMRTTGRRPLCRDCATGRVERD